MDKKDRAWEEFGGYMSAKLQKLDDQFKDGNDKKISSIFAGVNIFINGYTNPPDYKIRELMQQHGGKFSQYYSKDVTHIIANTLSKSKIDKLKNEKILTPGWILDSVNAGRLLEWFDYQLYSERYNSNQVLMKNFVQKEELDTGAISIKEYYSKSRLHHLSMWAHQLNAYLKTLKDNENEDSGFPGRAEFLNYYDSYSEKKIDIVKEAVIMHIDMDCFFVSVGIRDRPNLIGCPVVVTHSNDSSSVFMSPKNSSMAAIASSSYEAREFGVKNGMLLGEAKRLCPHLCPISYQFDQYLEVSKSLYRTIARFTHDIEVGSCDELYVSLTDILKLPNDSSDSNTMTIINPLIFANYVRSVIRADTQCPSSCGIGSNLISCKLATKKAKPDGSFWLKSSEAEHVVKNIQVRDMPGIGRVMEEKLKGLSVATFGDLQNLTLKKLQSVFGTKTAKKLFDNCRGKDDRVLQVDKQRKTISAEVNYGIRLSSMEECESFFKKLSTEIAERLKVACTSGSQLTLKIMTRHPDASLESAKYLGHGVCENFSKSAYLPTTTNDENVIFKCAFDLFRQLKKDVVELRGVGLVMQKLKSNMPEELPKSASSKIDDFFTKMGPTQTKKRNLTPQVDEDDCKIMDDVTYASCATLSTKSFREISGGIRTLTTTLNNVQNKNVAEFDSDDDKAKVYLAKLGRTCMDELKIAIEEWVDSEDVPMREDVVLMRDQIVSMVADSVAAVHELITLLADKVEAKHPTSAGGKLWKECCDDIVRGVQEACFNQFGAYLEMC